ncbi:tetratricopeptide repeat protein [Tenuifilum thalassicum]|uniref:Tetratricopeptide repeat protein n=1 Tax=Tenuifilum thalassicum TaxID=2590900 RepID=A0A7D4BE94_9BACT|nr:tetratricopeptide repeat protein [Tenuifilum thalassicum]QKG80483.1 tetratricopeptide repeat protein [Tenuifilum thalassicum]
MLRYFSTLLVFCSFSAFVFAQSDVNELIESGNQKIKERNFKAASSDFKNALEISPDDTAALNGIILTYIYLKDFREANKWIEQALEKHPENPAFLYRRGIVNNLNDNYEKAISDFEEALAKKPYTSLTIQILLNKASSHYKLEQYNEALDIYNKVIELDPRNFKAYNFRGLVNFKLGYFVDAVTDYTKAIDLDPSYPLPYYNRGMSLLKLNELQSACSDFRKACQLGYVNSCKMVVAECGVK